MGNNAVIGFREVSKYYGDRLILDRVNLEVEKGEFIVVIGSSGSGKTTLLKLINGLIKPDEGAVYVENRDVSQSDLILLRRRIGYVIQGVALFPHLSVRRNIGYVPSLLKRQNAEEVEAQVKRLMKLLDLDDAMLDRYPSELSGGQKQRVGIARALAANPSILLMDEPFSAVDEITRQSLQTELLKLHRVLHTTILFVTHDIQEAKRLADRIIVIHDGRIEQIGSPEEIMSSPATSYIASLFSN